MTILQSDFVRWEQDPVTIDIMRCLKELHSSINEQIVSGGYIIQDNGLLKLNYLLGKRHGIEELLNLSYEEYPEEIIETNNNIYEDQ